MSRRANAKPAGFQTFPFLAVLICTMGALVVLLHAFARHGQLQAIEVAKANVRVPEINVEDIQWRVGHIRAARAKTQAQLADERLKLAHVEDHQRRLQEKLDQLKRAAAELDRAGRDKDDQSQSTAAELEALKDEVEEAQTALDAARKKANGGRVNYSIVPYDGVSATNRRPVYIECRAESIILQPEGIVFTPKDFAGYFGPSNPLAAALRAHREYLARQAPAGQLADEPYPLLMVRPDGVMTYNNARQALVSWGSDIGYELIGADWELKFREPDPELAEYIQKTVGEARVRHRQYVLTAPHVSRQRSRPVYRARPHGGFAQVGDDSRGSRGMGRGGSPWDGDGDDWGSSRDVGSGDDPYGTAERSGSLSRGGSSFDDPYATSERGNGVAPGGNAGSGEPYGAPGDRDRLSAGGQSMPRSGTPYDSPAGAGSPNGTSPMTDPYAKSDGDRTEEEPGSPHFGGQLGGEGTIPGMLGTEVQGAAGASAKPGGSPGNSSASSASGQSGESGDCSENCKDESTQLHAPSHGSKKRKPQSIAATRGFDWGLPQSGGGNVAATRPVRILCFSDRLVVMPESQRQVPREIPLQAQTRDSMDELVSAVWEHMKSWGTAGKKLYWRPALSMDVQPGAEQRYAEIEALLTDSGIDVERRRSRTTGQSPRPGTRQPIRH